MQFESSYRQILKLAIPISLSLLIPQVSFMANAAFLGRLGTYELEVNSLCSIYYLLLTWVGFGLSNGVMVIISRRFGEKDTWAAARSFGNAFVLSILISLFLSVITYALAPLLFRLTLSSSEVASGCATFIRLRLLSFPFLMLMQLMTVYFIATNRSRRLIWGALNANIITIFFDYTLIFGNFGFVKLGVDGAAVASVLGEFVFFVVLWTQFFLNKDFKRFPFLRYTKLSKKLVLSILKVASPLILQYVFSIGGWLLFFIYVEHLGAAQLAASHIIRSVLGITGIVTWALASTCNTMVSNLLGQQKSHEVLTLVKKLLSVSFAYAIVICVLLQLFPLQFFAIYTHDATVVQEGLLSLKWMSYSILALSLGTICFNAVIGSGKTFVNLAIEIFCVGVYMVYVTIVVEKMKAPLHWGWASEFVYWGLLFIISGFYLLKKFGKKSLQNKSELSI